MSEPEKSPVPAHEHEVGGELTETEKMHKFAVDQINESKKRNHEERVKKLEAAKKEAEQVQVRAKHAQAPPASAPQEEPSPEGEAQAPVS